MRTLLVSDLHLGNRAGRDVIRQPVARNRLLDALEGVDRLVLLGDTAELRHRHPARSLTAAEPVLRAIGERVGARPGAEVIVVPGNHDRPLLRPWLREQERTLGVSAGVEPGVTRGLSQVVSWLGPATVRVAYPGVWLGERTYATHGHYLDRHLVPESAFGLPRGRLRAPVSELGRPRDYEWRVHRRRRPRPADRSLGRLLAGGVETAVRQVGRTLLPAVPELLMQADLASVSSRLLDAQMRHAALPAIGRVIQRLGIHADFVIFGHVHRLGPVAGDRPGQWRTAPDGPKLFNTGSWLYEPLLLDGATPPSPYWPGGAILIENEDEPRPLNLLEGLTAAELNPAR